MGPDTFDPAASRLSLGHGVVAVGHGGPDGARSDGKSTIRHGCSEVAGMWRMALDAFAARPQISDEAAWLQLLARIAVADAVRLIRVTSRILSRGIVVHSVVPHTP